ncbi:MAG TPA: hypothetical protein VND93_17850, partial [Myxococcales bacterium]|nr:hypothetical protein [Myxococcales bacterium]
MMAFGLMVALSVPWRGAYPGSRLVPVGAEAMVLGQPQRMAYFSTADAPWAVADFYARCWRAEGFPVVVQPEPSRGAVVAAAFSTRSGLVVAVVADRVAPGRTLAFLVIRALGSKRPDAEV